MTCFRPCIDLHSGQVKQIVGATLTDDASQGPKENFVSEKPAAHYAELYKKDGLTGGHVIMLGKGNDEAAAAALAAYPNGLQVGGGITTANAAAWITRGASHVIVTSTMFEADKFSQARVAALRDLVGKDKLVLDLSCKRADVGGEAAWVVAKDRWQTLTDLAVDPKTLSDLSEHCDEFLIHAADVEGKCQGIDEDLVRHLGSWSASHQAATNAARPFPVTYAGGAKSIEDLKTVSELSNGRVHLTYGSALDIFGGSLVKYADCVAWNKAVAQ